MYLTLNFEGTNFRPPTAELQNLLSFRIMSTEMKNQKILSVRLESEKKFSFQIKRQVHRNDPRQIL